MSERPISPSSEKLVFGSEMEHDPKEMSPAVAEFQELARRGALNPRVLSFDEIREHRADNPDKTITQNCVEAVRASIDNKPNGRFYTHSNEAADFIQGKNQRSNLSRTSICESSAHQVFFTSLSGAVGRVRVAVKPFTKKDEQATDSRGALVAEWVNTHIAQERGFGAFRPIGFVPTLEGGYMLTERRDDVEPMDNTEWTGMLLEPEDNADMLEEMKKFGPLLARLHDAGGFHGDPQIKNGVLTEEGELEFIDWEASKFVERPVWGANTTGREEQLMKLSWRDLTVLFGSMTRSVADKGVGFLDNFTPQAQWSFFREYILTPYIEERIRLVSTDLQVDQDEVILHLSELETKIEKYILEGEMYMGLARTRARINA